MKADSKRPGQDFLKSLFSGGVQEEAVWPHTLV
jgi:hypothetical protein